jgi:hypothetical protein
MLRVPLIHQHLLFGAKLVVVAVVVVVLLVLVGVQDEVSVQVLT